MGRLLAQGRPFVRQASKERQGRVGSREGDDPRLSPQWRVAVAEADWDVAGPSAL